MIISKSMSFQWDGLDAAITETIAPPFAYLE